MKTELSTRVNRVHNLAAALSSPEMGEADIRRALEPIVTDISKLGDEIETGEFGGIPLLATLLVKGGAALSQAGFWTLALSLVAQATSFIGKQMARVMATGIGSMITARMPAAAVGIATKAAKVAKPVMGVLGKASSAGYAMATIGIAAESTGELLQTAETVGVPTPIAELVTAATMAQYFKMSRAPGRLGDKPKTKVAGLLVNGKPTSTMVAWVILATLGITAAAGVYKAATEQQPNGSWVMSVSGTDNKPIGRLHGDVDATGAIMWSRL